MSNTKPNSSQITYDTGVNKQDLNSILDTVVPIADYDALRLYNGRATQVRVTADGIAGFFKLTDNTTTPNQDNGGTIIVKDATVSGTTITSASGKPKWERVFDGSVQLSWFQVAADGTDQADKIQAAIDSTPSGETVVCNISGTVIVDIKTSRFVKTRNGKNYSALKISKPITFLGNGSFVLKIKDFSTAWAASALGDLSAAIAVTSSFATVKDVRINCNGKNHYKIISGEKWWEYTTTLSGSFFPSTMTTRPPIGVLVIPSSIDGATVTNVLVVGNKIDDCLAGVHFSGNLSPEKDASFLAGDHTIGTTKACLSERNTVTGSRGNAVLFVNGVDSCESVSDTAINCMYYAGRFYSTVTNCKISNITEKIDVEAIIAKWNPTDNGYWRTDRTSTDAGGGATLAGTFCKVVCCGVRFGSAYNFNPSIDGGQHNIINCTVDGFSGSFKKHPNITTHDAYYYHSMTDAYSMSAVSAVMTPPGCIVRNVYADGYLQTLSFYAGAAAISAAKTGTLSVFNVVSVNTEAYAIQIHSINSLSIVGFTSFDGDGYAMLISDCSAPFIDCVQLGLKNKTGTRYGITFTGTTSSPVVGKYNADANYLPVNQIVGDSARYPFKGSILTNFSYQNSWAASEWLAAVPRYAVTAATGIDSKTVLLQLCLSGVSSTATAVLTLPAKYCPKVAIPFTLIDAVSGKVCMAIIHATGGVYVYKSGAASDFTALIGSITYPTV